MLERAFQEAMPVFADGEDGKMGRNRGIDPRQVDEFSRRFQPEPVERVRAQSEKIGEFADGGEFGPPDHFHGDVSPEFGQVEFHRLDKTGKTGHHQDHIRFVAAQVDQDLAILRSQEFDAAPAEGLVLAAEGDHPLHEVEQRRGVPFLGFHVDGGVAVDRVHDHRQIETGGIGLGETGVAVG